MSVLLARLDALVAKEADAKRAPAPAAAASVPAVTVIVDDYDGDEPMTSFDEIVSADKAMHPVGVVGPDLARPMDIVSSEEKQAIAPSTRISAATWYDRDARPPGSFSSSTTSSPICCRCLSISLPLSTGDTSLHMTCF